MGRPPCCDKANVKRGLWTAEEDAKILAYVSTHGTSNWTQVPKKAGLNRCGKSCRLRWTNYLRPDLKHEEFTEQEEQLIIQYHAAIGSRWSLIAKQLPGRTDNDVKNYWNTKLKKKLSKLGIDPVTHKPFTKIFSDFQNITCLSTTHHSSYSSSLSFQPGIQTHNPNVIHLTEQYPDNNVYSYHRNNSLLHQESFNHYTEELSPTSSCSSASASSSVLSEGQLLMSAGCNWGDPSFAQPLQTGEKTVENAATEISETSNQNESSSVSSFVKALLDRDSEMQMNLIFPDFEDILNF